MNRMPRSTAWVLLSPMDYAVTVRHCAITISRGILTQPTLLRRGQDADYWVRLYRNRTHLLLCGHCGVVLPRNRLRENVLGEAFSAETAIRFLQYLKDEFLHR